MFMKRKMLLVTFVKRGLGGETNWINTLHRNINKQRHQHESILNRSQNINIPQSHNIFKLSLLHYLQNSLYYLISSYKNLIWAKYKEQKNSRVAFNSYKIHSPSQWNVASIKKKTFAGVPDVAVSHKSNKIFRL